MDQPEHTPTIGEILPLGSGWVEWEIRAILGNIIVCRRADIEGEPTSHLQVLSLTLNDYRAIKNREMDKVLKLRVDSWGQPFDQVSI